MSAIVRYSPLQIAPVASATALDLPDDLSFEEWVAIGTQLGRAEHSVSWWIGDWWAFGEHHYGGRKLLVEDESWQGPSFETCKKLGVVSRAFERFRRRNLLPFTHHNEVSAVPPKIADEMLDQAEREELSAMQLRAVVRAWRASQRIGQIIAQPLPTHDPVQILYADPPWRYENPPMGGGNRSIENQYPTLTLDEICALDVSRAATDDAVLFLWATAPKCAECFQVIEAWGFIYRTQLVWDKVLIGMGYHARNQHELLLIAKRGEIPPPAPEDRPASIVQIPRGEHSEKPVRFYEIIECMYPRLRKRELFARSPARPGWEESWGNQQLMAAAE